MFKKILLTTFLLTSILFSQNEIPVAVMKLSAVGVASTDARIITSRLRNNLFKTNKFTVVERGKMNTILEEQGFQLSGCTSEECMVDAGKLLGVRLIIAGEIGKIGNLFTLSVRMIDVETGKILRMASRDCKCDIEDILTITVGEVASELAGVKNTQVIKTGKTDKKNESNWDYQLSAAVGAHFGEWGGPEFGIITGYSKRDSWRLGVKFSGGETLYNLTIQYEKVIPFGRVFRLTSYIGIGLVGDYNYINGYYDHDYDFYRSSYYDDNIGFGLDLGVGAEFKIAGFMFIKPTINYQLGVDDNSSIGTAVIFGFLF